MANVMPPPPPGAAAQAQPEPVEIRVRIVSAILIIIVVGLAVTAYWLSIKLGKLEQTAIAAMFGALTTFLGTALGAYFGISAASSSVRTLSTAVQASADQVKNLAGSNATLQADNATLRNTTGSQQQAIDSAHRMVGDLASSSSAADADKLKTVQTVLKPV